MKTVEWPTLKVGLGPAMTKAEAAAYLGKTLYAIEAAQRRTRERIARVDFPEPDGYAIPPGAARRTPVAYWFMRTIKKYGEDFEADREVFMASRSAGGSWAGTVRTS